VSCLLAAVCLVINSLTSGKKRVIWGETERDGISVQKKGKGFPLSFHERRAMTDERARAMSEEAELASKGKRGVGGGGGGGVKSAERADEKRVSLSA
jgi:hypothetical protein